MLYAQEGLDNEKFSSQPSNKRAKVAYRILHYRLFYWLIFLATLGLLLLAIFEQPSKFSEIRSRAEKAVSTCACIAIIHWDSRRETESISSYCITTCKIYVKEHCTLYSTQPKIHAKPDNMDPLVPASWRQA